MATTATSSEWARVINTTIANYLKGYSDQVLRHRKLLDAISRRGNIKRNAYGDKLVWRVRKSQGTVSVNDGAQSLTFAPENRFDTAELDYIGYAITDAMRKREKLKNRNVAAIVKVWDETVKLMLSDLEDKFSEDLYINDAAAGNTGKLAGLNTVHKLAATARTVSVGTTTSTTARTANAADPVGYPEGTYANINIELGQEGGTWNANWPFGSGDAEFDYWTPLHVNFTSTYFDGTSTTWADNCELAMRFGLVHSRRNKASEGLVDLVVMDAERYVQLLNKHSPKERVIVNQGARDRDYGTDEPFYIYMEGAKVCWEFGVPAAQVFGVNTKQLELHSMQDDLFVAEGPTYEEQSRSWRVACDFIGQLKCNSPRSMVKWSGIA